MTMRKFKIGTQYTAFVTFEVGAKTSIRFENVVGTPVALDRVASVMGLDAKALDAALRAKVADERKAMVAAQKRAEDAAFAAVLDKHLPPSEERTALAALYALTR